VCCSEAVKNALALKEQRPEAQVVVLAKDIRTYGFRDYSEGARGWRAVRALPRGARARDKR